MTKTCTVYQNYAYHVAADDDNDDHDVGNEKNKDYVRTLHVILHSPPKTTWTGNRHASDIAIKMISVHDSHRNANKKTTTIYFCYLFVYPFSITRIDGYHN